MYVDMLTTKDSSGKYWFELADVNNEEMRNVIEMSLRFYATRINVADHAELFGPDAFDAFADYFDAVARLFIASFGPRVAAERLGTVLRDI